MEYGSALVAACLTGVLCTLGVARAIGAPLRAIALPLVLTCAFALMGAKALSIAERGGQIVSLTHELTFGYRYPGGIAGFLLALALLRCFTPGKIPLLRFADMSAPAIPIAVAVARLGCLHEGCCAGSVCHLPWGMTYPAGSRVWYGQLKEGLIDNGAMHSLPVHPLQLYFLAASLCIAAALLWLVRGKHYDGQVFVAFLLLQGSVKLVLETLRDESVVLLPAVSLAFVLGALTFHLMRRRRWDQRRFATGGEAPT